MKSVKLLFGSIIAFIGLGLNCLGIKIDDLSDYILTKSTDYCNKINPKIERW